MARAIISMSETLRLMTIAEGIETPEQADILRALGCDRGQGYLFSKPLPEDEITEFLKSQPKDEHAQLLTTEEYALLSQNPALSELLHQIV